MRCKYIKDMKNRITELRKNRKMTQEKLGELCDTTKGVISLIESGKRPLNSKWIERISNALGCEPSDLFESNQHPLFNVLETFEKDELDELLLIANRIRGAKAS